MLNNEERNRLVKTYEKLPDAVIKGDAFHHAVFLVILQHDNELIQNAQFRRPTATLMFLLIIRLQDFQHFIKSFLFHYEQFLILFRLQACDSFRVIHLSSPALMIALFVADFKVSEQVY